MAQNLVVQRSKKVLEIISNWTIIGIYIKSIVVGLWVIIKWFIHFLWQSVNQKKTNESMAIDVNKSQYDTPPQCLVDSKCGRHNYVKLKVSL